MSWNYRIVKCAVPPDRQAAAGENFHYVLCEIYYNAEGQPDARTEAGATFHADADEGPGAIADALKRALRDATERPVLNEWEILGLEHLAPAAA